MGLLFSGSARATPSDALARAAELFDRGVHEFDGHHYEAAVNAFLSADTLQPSRDALTNAFTAALKSEQDVLVATSARRVIDRADIPPQTRQRARHALMSAEKRLARVDASCAPLPCSLQIDGKDVGAGVHYVLPGSHEIAALGAEDSRAAQQLSCEAGTLYVAKLEPLRSEAPAATSESPLATAETTPMPAITLPADGPAREVAAAPPAPSRAPTSWLRRERIPLLTLAGVGAAAATLGALTIWSGLQALSARDEYKTSPRTYDPAEVHRLARRTDMFLGGALLCAAGAGAMAFWWVDWRSSTPTVVALVPAHGLVVVSETRF